MDREQILEWWNTLTFTERYHLTIKFKDILIGYPRNPDSLTGSEIEKIYKYKRNS